VEAPARMEISMEWAHRVPFLIIPDSLKRYILTRIRESMKLLPSPSHWSLDLGNTGRTHANAPLFNPFIVL